jgi:hypothetical protein
VLAVLMLDILLNMTDGFVIVAIAQGLDHQTSLDCDPFSTILYLPDDPARRAQLFVH